jgi:conjugative relaxase-like TrwC/TraI family protein
MALGKNISPGQGETYYRKDDYYLEREGGDEHKLEWGGKLAPELGLSGKAGAEEWKNALNGHFPDGIEIKGGSFKDPETGELLKRAGTDFVIEAPKTISMLYAATDNQEIKDWIMEVQSEVEKVSFDYLESQIGSRQGKDGKNWETTGKALYGHTRHFTNREGECHIHGHGVFLNLTRNSSGKYKAMTNDRMMQHQRALKEIGEALWALRMRQAGYEIEKGKYGEVQLAGFTRDQIEAASSRSRDIEQYIKDKWGLEWSKLPREERNEKRFMHDEAWDRTRKAKKVHEMEKVEERWKEEARVIGYDVVVRKLEEQFEKGIKPKYLSLEKRLEIARESLAFAVEHHTERESAVKEGELIRTALQGGRGKITMEDLTKAIEEAKDSGVLIRQADDLAKSKQNLVTSREALGREKRILRMEKEGRGAVEPIMNPFQAEAAIKRKEIENGMEYSPEQKTAMMLFLTSDNRFIGVNGFAGTGKTTLWKPSIEIARNAGYDVIGLSPQHSGKDALKESFEIFKNSLGIDNVTTVQAWLTDREAGKRMNEKTIVILDEAGLSSMKTAESVMRRIEKAGARAPFSGDKLQYESVEAGPAFRLLQDRGMETVKVTKMQRQKDAPENIREAARLSVLHPEEAIRLLDVREYKNPEERYRAIADDYLHADDRKETLVLVETHETKRAVNSLVREALSLNGKGQIFESFIPYDKTRAQLKRIDTYEEGQRLLFSKKYRSLGVASGEDGKITSVNPDEGTLSVEMRSGKRIVMTPREMSGKGHKVGQIELLELSQSDRVRVTGNQLKKSGITNGMKGDVVSVTQKEATIRLDNGKIFTVSRETIAELVHSYAQTGHSAQGLGAGKEKELEKLLKENLKKEMVGGVILDIPTHSKMVSRRSFMTNLTRSKNRATVYTDDKSRLEEAVSREKDKTMAHDVEKWTERKERGTETKEERVQKLREARSQAKTDHKREGMGR